MSNAFKAAAQRIFEDAVEQRRKRGGSNRSSFSAVVTAAWKQQAMHRRGQLKALAMERLRLKELQKKKLGTQLLARDCGEHTAAYICFRKSVAG